MQARSWIAGACFVFLLAPQMAIALPPGLSEIEARPSWLFPADACPHEVISRGPEPIRYLADGCRDRAARCVSGCRGGDGSDCYALALLIEEGDPHSEYASALFLRACRLGIDSGCTNRAARMASRWESDVAPEKLSCAVRTFGDVCARGDPWACAMLGLHLAHGRGIEQDLERAAAALRKACEVRDEEACIHSRDLLREIEAALEQPR